MSKLSIGVYGDSFASMNLDIEGSFSWIDQLRTIHDVSNYGECGNSISKCYRTYLKNHEFHDYNIFIIPAQNRFYSEKLYHLLEDSHTIKNWFATIGSLDSARINVEVGTSPSKLNKLKIIQSVRIALLEWLDYEFLKEINDLLIDKISNDKNLILVNTNPTKNGVSLTAVSFRELEEVGYKEKYLDKGLYLNVFDNEKKLLLSDSRCNHLSEENNLIFGNILLSAISNNYSGELELSHKDFVKPSKPLEHYLKWTSI